MDLPKKLIPVLADIRHQSETGKHQWYEIVYHDGKRWCHYAGSDTFNDGESVKQWKYAEECLPKESVPLGCVVRQGAVQPVLRTDIEEKYNELIMAVAKKFTNETRHETALRYINEAESFNDNSCAKNESEQSA